MLQILIYTLIWAWEAKACLEYKVLLGEEEPGRGGDEGNAPPARGSQQL
jgi:hypothetical protein